MNVRMTAEERRATVGMASIFGLRMLGMFIVLPVLALYAELDRALTTQMGGVMTNMLQQQKTLGFVVYQGANHAFHNDTGAAYNAAAACDAWARTIAWFNKYLRS